MPKEKTSKRGAAAPAKSRNEKKKKGKLLLELLLVILHPSKNRNHASKKRDEVPLTDTVFSFFSDPNAPKRGLSAYMFFANEQRENVREENPGISFG